LGQYCSESADLGQYGLGLYFVNAKLSLAPVGFRGQDLGLSVYCSEFGLQDFVFGFSVQVSGFRVQGLGFRLWGFRAKG